MAELKKGFESYEQRKKLYQDAFMWNDPERILLNANLYAWMYEDCGLTTKDCGFDFSLVEKSARESIERYNFDVANVSGSVYRYDLTKYEMIGKGNWGVWKLNEKGEMNATDSIFFGAEDYDLMEENLLEALWTKILFRMYPNTKNLTPQEFAAAAERQTIYGNAVKATNQMIRDEYGVLVEDRPFVANSAIDSLFTAWRGMRGLASDLRRQPERLYEYCKRTDENRIQGLKNTFDDLPYGPAQRNYFDSKTAVMAHNMLNPKQIEKYFIGTFYKPLLDYMDEHGKLAFLQCEGVINFRDLLNDYRKGVINIVVEMDDPYQLRKECPNICLSGGLSVDTMGNGTPEECVDMAKKAIDNLNDKGGLILTSNKMVSYKYDMNRENLIAVSEFVHNYKLR